MRWPRLPRRINAPRGPVTVKVWPKNPPPPEEGKILMGEWHEATRTIYLRRGLKPDIAWDVLMHEMTHCWLHDSNIHISDEKAEDVCDAVAAGVMRYLHHDRMKA